MPSTGDHSLEPGGPGRRGSAVSRATAFVQAQPFSVAAVVFAVVAVAIVWYVLGFVAVVLGVIAWRREERFGLVASFAGAAALIIDALVVLARR